MRYATVCSGIGAPECAWKPLGWECMWQAEIEPFPSAVLAHHFPGVPNRGDMERFKEWPDAEESKETKNKPIELLCGGTPCQSFSVAGLRKGLDDPRGNLALVFLGIIDRYRPRWVVWENVPGVLSVDGGRAFGAFIGGLAQLGYGLCWRVLDAQYFGVPQRRRRVFVAGCLGDWRPACAVLLEPEGMRGDSPPRRQAGAGAARCLARGAGGGSGYRHDANGEDFVTEDWPADVAPTLGTGWADRQPGSQTQDFASQKGGHYVPGEIAQSIRSRDGARGVDSDCTDTLIAHSLRAEGFDASEDGTGRGTPIIPILEAGARQGTKGDHRDGLGIGQPGDPMFTLSGKEHAVAIPFNTTQITSKGNYSAPKPGNPCHPLVKGAHPPAVIYDMRGNGDGNTSPTLSRSAAGDRPNDFAPMVHQAMSVRRLTPRECERLQGFPDDYTAIDFRGKPAADGPRYRAIGNSMAVPVMRWLGERIRMFEGVISARPA